MNYEDIIGFWFEECQPQDWWQKNDEFDKLITQRFAHVLNSAIAGELISWRENALGSLAEIIVLDQFSRNIYRDLPQSFSQDPQALCLSQRAIERGFDMLLDEQKRAFLYMPFMHSESKVIHEQAAVLFKNLDNYEFEVAHKKIIDQFGRYPHRNEILGRTSTETEIIFLQQPNSSF